MKISKKYANHGAELRSIANYIMGQDGTPTDAAIRLGISADEVNNINALRLGFETAYTAYISPTTHNSIAVHAMKEADDNVDAIILPLRKRLKNGLAILTAADYANLTIHENKTTRTPTEIPKDMPMPILIESQLLHLTFEVKEQTSEGVTRVAMPKYCKIVREIAIVAAGTEPSDGDYRTIHTVGRCRFTIAFTAAEVGMNMYIRIAYENSAGRGSFSMPVKAIII